MYAENKLILNHWLINSYGLFAFELLESIILIKYLRVASFIISIIDVERSINVKRKMLREFVRGNKFSTAE